MPIATDGGIRGTRDSGFGTVLLGGFGRHFTHRGNKVSSSFLLRGRVTAAATIVAVAGSAFITAVPASAATPGTNGEIAYTVDGQQSIFFGPDAAVAGTPLLSDAGTRFDDVSYSADGTKIVYVSNGDLGGNPEGNDELWMADASGANRTQLTFTGANIANRDPSWSPDGERLVFVSIFPFGARLDPELVSMEAVANAPIARLTWSYSADEADPVYHPSGDFIVFSTRRFIFGQSGETTWDLWRMYDDNGLYSFEAPLALTFDVHEQDPDYSPDGKSLVYSKSSLAGGDDRIWVSASDGSGAHMVSESTVGVATDPVFSPDGARLAYTADGSTVRTMDLNGGAGNAVAEIVGDTAARPSWRAVDPYQWEPDWVLAEGVQLKLTDRDMLDRRVLEADLTAPGVATIGNGLIFGSAEVQVAIDGAVGTYELPNRNWTRTVRKGVVVGYTYRDTALDAGPVKAAKVDLVKGTISVSGKGIELNQSLDVLPLASPVRFEFRVGDVGVCAVYGGTIKYNVPPGAAGTRTWRATKAPVPASC